MSFKDLFNKQQVINQAADFVIGEAKEEVQETLIKRTLKYTWKLFKNLSKLIFKVSLLALKSIFNMMVEDAKNNPVETKNNGAFFDDSSIYADEAGWVDSIYRSK